MTSSENDPEDVIVRLADDASLDDLVGLLRACADDMRSHGFDQWDDVYPNRSTLQADVQGRASFVAVTDARAIIGAFTLNQHQDPEYADVPWQVAGLPVAVVHRLMVHPGAQRTGLGRFLMGFAERRARRLGFRALRLDTLAENRRALALYRGLGYREAGTVTFRKGLFVCFEKALDDPSLE